MLENLDKIMHLRFNFDACPMHSPSGFVHLTHQNLSARALFCLNSLAKVNTQLLIYNYDIDIIWVVPSVSTCKKVLITTKKIPETFKVLRMKQPKTDNALQLLQSNHFNFKQNCCVSVRNIGMRMEKVYVQIINNIKSLPTARNIEI